MNRTEKLTELRSLQARCDVIRQELQINSPGEVLFLAPLGEWSDSSVVVAADGLGGATTSVVQGNYPVDYVNKFERGFPTESEAGRAAEEVAFGGVAPDRVLGAAA
jgi:hypothetical protein